MQNLKITFIGVGHMASAMVNGLLADQFPAENITVTNKSLTKLEHLSDQLIKTTDNHIAIANADVVILAVKPQVLEHVIAELNFNSASLIISIAAGITMQQLQTWIGEQFAIVRAMPNMPAAVGRAATGLFANIHVTKQQKQLTKNIINSFGISVWLQQEKLLATVTAIAGSAPAYYFYLMQCLQQFAVAQGMDADAAKQLIQQTCAGSGELAIADQKSFDQLKQSIMSPNGITEAAIEYLEQQNFESLINTLCHVAVERDHKLK